METEGVEAPEILDYLPLLAAGEDLEALQAASRNGYHVEYLAHDWSINSQSNGR